MDVNLLVLQLLNGLALGVLYLLIASGLSVIFGMTDIINFAHGALYMLGAYVGLSVIDATGSFWLALLLAPLSIGVVGVFLERTTLHRIYDRDPLYHIILTFGLTLMLSDAVEFIWGKSPQQFPGPDAITGAVALGPIFYPKYKLFLIVAGIAVAGGVWLLFEKTNFGLIVRGGAQSRQTVRIMGINISNYFTLVFGLAAVLAGVAGVLAGPFLNVTPTMGDQIIITAFIVVVVGGLGSFRGSVVAALLIGLVQSLGTVFVPQLTGFLVYLLMILVLLVRPQGLLGEYEVRSDSTKVTFSEIIEPVSITDKRALGLLGVLALVPLGMGSLYSPYFVGLLSLMFIWALLALSLDMVMGYMGLLSFGHAAFFGIGAYATGLFTMHVFNSFVAAAAVAIVVAAGVAWIIGALSIRLTGVYFAMITLAFAQMFHQLALTWNDVTGGSDGLTGMPTVDLFGAGLVSLGDTATFYYFALFVTVAAYVVTVKLLDSPFGRVVTAIRESERRVSFLGYDTNVYKRRAFALSGAIGGLAGALLATYQTFVSAGTLHWVVSGDVVIAMMFGGIGTLFGPMFGAGLFIGLQEILSSYTDQWRFVLGLLLVLTVMVAPRGLITVYSSVRDAVRLRMGSGGGPQRDAATDGGENR
ncbi:ABC transporter permease [Halogeometricum limi]|uniref:Branched-chain amino acid transport system permease protein n=1 Tax=Halogeometricum limi TaxID=555875 RepID=A0A1I6IBD5_9EURY|nr:ABC transporter permease [Halogeometricum limi]SFR63986.1 branched-chain amino acid transport system permease protein [Halogeometricum limi]